MAEVEVFIGGRSFKVACADGEEQYLTTAAGMLDEEAQTLVSQIGRLPVERMLLMAGLMLADRTAAFEEKANAAEQKLAHQEKLIAEMSGLKSPAAERVEVPVMPSEVIDNMAEIAARVESLAAQAEESVS